MANDDDKNNTPREGEEDGFDPTRRRFIKNTGFALGGVAGGSLLGGLLTNQFLPTDEKEESKDTRALLQDARTFFNREDDFETLAAATERIYPEDDHGPGAIALGVPYFIDKQLASHWGTNYKEYTKGPFKPQESDTHGLQAKMNRGEMFLTGLRKMQNISQDEHDSEFFDLDGEDQVEILQRFESGDVDVKGMRPHMFFELLRQTTLEGVYADPAYGGNHGMEAWKMMEYPGPRTTWGDDIETEEFLSMEPKSLRAYQGGDD